MTDHAELRALALAALAPQGPPAPIIVRVEQLAFWGAATPDRIIAMVDERDTALARAEANGWAARGEADAASQECGCPNSAKIAALPPNSAARWRLCGQDNCSALVVAEIRALQPPAEMRDVVGEAVAREREAIAVLIATHDVTTLSTRDDITHSLALSARPGSNTHHATIASAIRARSAKP